MDGSVLWNVSLEFLLQGESCFMSDSLLVCVKLYSLDFKSIMFCLLFTYLVYITIILFWNQIEHLPLAHLKVLLLDLFHSYHT